MEDAAPLRIRFEVQRSEWQRAEAAAAAGGIRLTGRPPFDEAHLVGRLHFDIGAPLLKDPILDFLREKRGLRADPPFTVSLDQPVAYAIGQLASATVMALHGEGAFTVRLAGGGGALTVAVEDGRFDLGVPLESYAGVLEIEPKAAAGAVAAAGESLSAMLRASGALSTWSVAGALGRDVRILRAWGQSGEGTRLESLPRTWSADAFAQGKGPAVVDLASAAEASGARVVPYWQAAKGGGEGLVMFQPLRSPSRGSRRGALARYLLPGGEATLEAQVEGDREGTQRLRARLARPTAFAARLRPGEPVRIEEPGHALPVA